MGKEKINFARLIRTLAHIKFKTYEIRKILNIVPKKPALRKASCGLLAMLRESGQWRGKTHIAKNGDASLRKALYMPAMVAWKHNPLIHVFCERLKANGKNGKVIVCAAMRKLIHIAFGVLKSGKCFDPNYVT